MVFCLCPLPVWSETVSQILSMEESIQLAFKVSPVLKAAQESILGAEFKKKQAQTGFLPKLSTQYNYYYVNTAQSITIPAQNNGLIPEST